MLDHYTAGNPADVGADNPNKSELIKPFALTDQQKADVLASLESLTDQTLLENSALSDPWPAASQP